jgi:hypothetical protein
VIISKAVMAAKMSLLKVVRRVCGSPSGWALLPQLPELQ